MQLTFSDKKHFHINLPVTCCQDLLPPLSRSRAQAAKPGMPSVMEADIGIFQWQWMKRSSEIFMFIFSNFSASPLIP